MAVAGLWSTVNAVQFLDTTARTDGTVVALERERGSKGLTEDHPVVRFVQPETGEAVKFTSRFGLWPSPFAVGEAVEVAYDPEDPERVEINSFWTIWLLPLVLPLFGLACLAAGFHNLRRTRPDPG